MSLLVRGSGGRLLRGPGGLLARGLDCCCDDGGGGGPCPCTCANYRFVTSGTSCPTMNRTSTMAKAIGACQWEEHGLWYDGVSPCTNLLTYDGTNWTLRIRVTSIVPNVDVYYRLSGRSWNCTGTNVMTRISTAGPCTGWPTTMSVSCI